MHEYMFCSMLTASDANPGIFRPGQLVEMSVNIRALLMGSLRNVVLRMDSLTMHDRYGAIVCPLYVNL
jgi:hypothetical protein